MAHFLPSGYRVLWTLRVSRYKVDRSREFIPGYKFGCGHWRSVAVQIVSEPEISHGTELLLRVDARVRVQQPLQICLVCRSKSKKCDKQLTHIVRVIVSCLCYCSCLISRLSARPQFIPIVVTLKGRFSSWKGIML